MLQTVRRTRLNAVFDTIAYKSQTHRNCKLAHNLYHCSMALNSLLRSNLARTLTGFGVLIVCAVSMAMPSHAASPEERAARRQQRQEQRTVPPPPQAPSGPSAAPAPPGSSRAGMSTDERREFRRQIREHGRDIYGGQRPQQ